MGNIRLQIDGGWRRYPAMVSAAAVVARLKDAGHQAYIVGGAVRDYLLGHEPGDVDVATSALPEEVEACFERCHRIGASFGVVLVVSDGAETEVASFRTEGEYLDGRRPANLNYTLDPEADAGRRDFTINALYLDPTRDEVLDFTGGLEDLRIGRLRTVGAARQRFAEDHLRMLRAVRFAVRLGFALDLEVSEAVCELASRIVRISAERIRDELDRMLTGPHPARAIEHLDRLGLLPFLLPEVLALKGVPQPPIFHPEGDVWQHTLLALEQLVHPDSATAWAVLLHDIAKPETLSFDDEGIPHHYRHELVGSEKAQQILERLKFPRILIETVKEAVASHMRYGHVCSMGRGKLRRLLAKPSFPVELELLRVDCMASHRRMEPYQRCLDELITLAGEPPIPTPLVNGRDVLSLGVKPGPHVGEILQAISELQIEGVITDRDTALLTLRKLVVVER